jgi:hypothetical protein
MVGQRIEDFVWDLNIYELFFQCGVGERAVHFDTLPKSMGRPR